MIPTVVDLSTLWAADTPADFRHGRGRSRAPDAAALWRAGNASWESGAVYAHLPPRRSAGWTRGSPSARVAFVLRPVVRVWSGGARRGNHRRPPSRDVGSRARFALRSTPPPLVRCGSETGSVALPTGAVSKGANRSQRAVRRAPRPVASARSPPPDDSFPRTVGPLAATHVISALPVRRAPPRPRPRCGLLNLHTAEHPDRSYMINFEVRPLL